MALFFDPIALDGPHSLSRNPVRLVAGRNASTGIEPLESRVLFATTFEHLFPEATSGVAFSDVAVDKQSGAIFATGNFNDSVDFDPGAETESIPAENGYDVFVARFTAEGELTWVKTYNIGSYEESNAIAVGKKGIAVVGQTSDFAGDTPFVLRYSLDGTRQLTAKGKIGFDGEMRSVGIDSNNNVYFGGFTRKKFTFKGTTIERPAKFDSAGFLLKIDKEGDVVWSKSLDEDAAFNGIAIDAADRVHVAGTFQGEAIDFEPDTSRGRIKSINDRNVSIFVAKLRSGGKFIWGNQLNAGKNNNDFVASAESVAVDSDGNVAITGQFSVALTDGEDIQLDDTNRTEIYVAKLNANGKFVFARQFHNINPSSFSGDSPTGLDIDFDSDGNLLVAGYYYRKIDFDPGAEEKIMNAGDDRNGFLLKLKKKNGGFLRFFQQAGSDKSSDFPAVAVGADGFPVVVGRYSTDEASVLLKLSKKLKK